MALTRKFLSALGIESDKVDEIIEAHASTVDALKEERDGYKEKAEKYDSTIKKLEKSNSNLEDVKKELAELKEAGDRNEWQDKYNELKSEYDNFKSDIEAKEIKKTKTNAFKKLLKDANISDKRFNTIVKVSSDTIDKIKLDENGNIKDADELSKSIQEEWSDFIIIEGSKGANTPTPPANNNDTQPKSRASGLAAKYHDKMYGKED